MWTSISMKGRHEPTKPSSTSSAVASAAGWPGLLSLSYPKNVLAIDGRLAPSIRCACRCCPQVLSTPRQQSLFLCRKEGGNMYGTARRSSGLSLLVVPTPPPFHPRTAAAAAATAPPRRRHRRLRLADAISLTTLNAACERKQREISVAKTKQKRDLMALPNTSPPSPPCNPPKEKKHTQLSANEKAILTACSSTRSFGSSRNARQTSKHACRRLSRGEARTEYQHTGEPTILQPTALATHRRVPS